MNDRLPALLEDAVAIDRDDVLRKAEKLLRQGRLDGAIGEYERVVQAYPEDVATATTLGDLYGRAGQAAQAVAQFMRIGDHWLREDVYAKAAASYRKVLKLDPQHESALLQLVEACARQGQLADAKTHLRSAIDRRLARADQEGADALVIRLSELDPTDFDARLAAGHIRLRTGKATSADLLELAQELDARDRGQEAEALLEEVVKRDPSASAVSLRLSKAALGRDELDRAKRFLPDTRQATDPELLLTAGQVLVRLGELDEARVRLSQYLSVAPQGAEQVAVLADALPAQAARYAILELLVEQAAANADYAKAARRLQGFLERAPRHVPALLRLVEICVDGDLDAALVSAQEELAEAYLDTNEADQARIIAEDLLLREPRSAAHRERLRRVLVTLGEADPDAVIADRLGLLEDETLLGPEPVSSSVHLGEPEPQPADRLADPPAVPEPSGAPYTPVAVAAAALAAAEEGVEFEPVDFEPWELPEEVDLTSALDRLSPTSPAGEEAVPRVPSSSLAPVQELGRDPEPEAALEAAAEPETLETVFAGIRGRIQQDPAALPPGDHAARSFRVGQTYAAAGMVKEAAEAFEQSARDPRYRFRSAQALGRLYRKQGLLREAVEWLDIASEAPAPKIDEHRSALYELAEALEETGQTTRALAVLLDLVAEQDDYRDARARIDRLSRVRA